MTRRVVKIAVGAIATIGIASFVIFAGLSLAPGDPVAQLLGPRSTDEARAAMSAQLGLDDPLPVRYWHWLTGVLHGDFGTSITYRESVTNLVGPRLVTTLLLVVMSGILVVVVGVGLGVLGGVSRRGRGIVAVLTGFGISVPSFVAASFLISIAAVKLGWFPTYGGGSGFADQLRHLILPAVALSIGYGAYVAQLTSAAVNAESQKEYVSTARGRGIPESIVIRKHVLRNAGLPVLTASGLAVAGLFAGTVVVEQAFSIDGIGGLLIRSVSSKDYAVVTAISMIIVVAFVIVTTAIDLVQALLDPREWGDT